MLLCNVEFSFAFENYMILYILKIPVSEFVKPNRG